MSTTDQQPLNGHVHVLHPEDLPDYGGVKPEDLTHEPGSGLLAGDVEEGSPQPARELGPPVDPPQRPRTTVERLQAAADAPRRPVLPEWAHTQAGRRAMARLGRSAGAHWVAYRTVHLIPDLVRIGWFALVGSARLVWLFFQAVTDGENRPLRRQSVLENDKKSALLLARQRDARASRRWFWAAWIGGVLLVAWLLFWWLAPGWLVDAAAATGVLGLAWVGRPVGKPILSPATVKSTTPRLTSMVVVRALAGLGLSPLSQGAAKNDTADWFPEPITRTAVGHEVPIELPHGVTAREVAERREKLAAGLRRPIGSVWPMEETRIHPGRLTLHVLDAPMSQMRQPPWPLAKGGKCDVFKPILLGWDQRGMPVRITLIFSNLLVGAIPRQGKSRTVRVLLLACAFDVTAELHVHELKGTDDYSALQPFAHRFTTGAGSSDTAAVESVMASIREVHSTLDPRAKTIARISREDPIRCPEKKVTRELASTPGLGLHPVVLAIDEVHELFESEHAAEALQLLTAIIKRGPALGIVLVLATQRPDARSVPTAISTNMATRFCLRVGDARANNTVLGDGAYAMGMNATLFTEDDKGVGLLRDGGVSAQTVRAADVDGPAADRIAKRALALRIAAGTLSGDAIGEHLEPEASRLEVVMDAVKVFRDCPSADESVWIHELEEALAEWDPRVYGDLEAPWLGARLRALGILTLAQRKRNVDGEQVNRAGVSLTALRRALEGETDGPR